MFNDALFKLNYPSELSFKTIFVMFYFTSTKVLPLIVSILFSLFYISVCIFLSRILRECGQRLKLGCKSAGIKQVSDRFIAEYTDVHRFACDIESSLSLQVLAICVTNFAELFAIFAIVLRFYPFESTAFIIEKAFISPINFTSLFGIAYFASEVQREDQEVRRALKEIMYISSLSKETWKSGEIMRRFIKSKENIVFSAWRVFNFSRGFLLASAGTIVSYNLLLLQLQ
ncbi:hypothetical protein AVEN_10026-1 [Araneus ventricosus]|uniref:Gustatory receptor n=1 Tax=Araneus ventricosus TaxID=182803 RepID=A0A4Y2H3Z7_ARAVE|nr:hypothetical protein AVEN_10026-1 [Araneus ventricosus]